MFVRVGVVAASIMGAGLFGAGSATAQELSPEQARAFVVGKLFSYTCFEGTAGQGRIFPDGSVVGTIRIRGQGETRFATLPPGTIRVDANSVCAHLSGLPFTPCFRVEKLDHRSFRGSLSGMGFAYCDFYQRNPRSQLISRTCVRHCAPRWRSSSAPSRFYFFVMPAHSLSKNGVAWLGYGGNPCLWCITSRRGWPEQVRPSPSMTDD
jgi:hypothetical protein